MALLLLLISQGRTPGGHGLLEAVPRIYQVTPDIPGRRRATKQEQVRPQIWPTASKRVSSPPVGTIPSASDITDDPNHNSKPQRYDDPLAPGGRPTTGLSCGKTAVLGHPWRGQAASSRATRSAPSRAIRERGTTRSKPAASARSRTSGRTCE